MYAFSHANRLIIYLSLVMSACVDKQFNQKHQYAIYVDRSRFYADIEQTISRLSEKGLEAYPVAMHTQHEGRYYYAMMYAEKSLQTIMARKIECEDKYRLKVANIINYKKEYKRILPLDESEVLKKTKLRAEKPKFSKDIMDFLEMIPYSADVRLKSLLFIKTPPKYLDKINTQKEFTSDLPRGILPSNLLKKTDFLAEILVYDALHKFQTTYTLALLRPKTFSEETNIAAYYADMILNSTPKGTIKEKIPIEIRADDKLTGYQVNIQIVKNKQRAYLVLTDVDRRYLIFVQEESNNVMAMTDWTSMTGETKGVLYYPEVCNSVYALPISIPNELIGWRVERLSNVAGNYGLKIEGAIKADFVFQHTQKGTWEAELYMLPDTNSLQSIFKEKYGDTNKEKIILDSAISAQAWLAFNKRKNGKNFIDVADEIRVFQYPYFAVFSNKNKAYLTESELVDIAKSFQLYKGMKNPHDWFDWQDLF